MVIMNSLLDNSTTDTLNLFSYKLTLRGLEPKISLKFVKYRKIARITEIFSFEKLLCREQDSNLQAFNGVTTSR